MREAHPSTSRGNNSTTLEDFRRSSPRPHLVRGRKIRRCHDATQGCWGAFAGTLSEGYPFRLLIGGRARRLPTFGDLLRLRAKAPQVELSQHVAHVVFVVCRLMWRFAGILGCCLLSISSATSLEVREAALEEARIPPPALFAGAEIPDPFSRAGPGNYVQEKVERDALVHVNVGPREPGRGHVGVSVEGAVYEHVRGLVRGFSLPADPRTATVVLQPELQHRQVGVELTCDLEWSRVGVRTGYTVATNGGA